MVACSGGSDVGSHDAEVSPGLTTHRTEENKQLLASSSKVDDEAQRILGPNYGGFWIEERDDNSVRLGIGVAGNIDATRRSQLMALPGTYLVPMKYSYAALRTMQTDIMELFRPMAEGSEPTIYTAILFQNTNSLEIRTKSENIEKVKALLQQQGFDLSALTFQAQEHPFDFSYLQPKKMP